MTEHRSWGVTNVWLRGADARAASRPVDSASTYFAVQQLTNLNQNYNSESTQDAR